MASGVVKSWAVPSGSLTQDGNSYAGAYYSFEWTSEKQSAGVTKVSWNLYGKGRPDASPRWLDNWCYIDVVKNGTTTRIYTNNWGDGNGNGDCTSFYSGHAESFRDSGTFTVNHDNDGNGSFVIKMDVAIYYKTSHTTTSSDQILDINKPQYTVSATKETGISNVSGTGTFDAKSSVTVTATPSTGYHFTSWTYGSNTYTANPWTITTSITGNISVTANAAVNSGTVYYYANGGTSTSGHSQDSSGKSNTTSSVNYSSTAANLYNVTTLFTRTGYHVASDASAWRYGSSTATTYFNQASQNFSPYLDAASEHGSNFNLYANWVANTYTINYNGNEGTGSTAATSCTYDSNATIRSNGFTRTGYKFIGWNTAANGTGTAYSEGQSVRNLTSTNGGSITLYAQWEALATMFVKVDGSYKAGIPYVKVAGEWKRATAVYVKVNGDWKLSTR